MAGIKLTKNKKYTVVVAANNNYSDFLSVLLISLKKNFQSYFEVFVVTDGLTKETQTKLKNISRNEFELNFLFLTDFQNKISFGDRIIDPHYWRLVAPHILHDRETILYLDADTMVRNDITELFSIKRENTTVSACVDYLEKIETGISNWKSFALNPVKKYFNSGVLLIDTKRFIEKKIAEQIIEVVENNKPFTKACGKWEQYDQYGFNVVLYGDWVELPIIYNYGSELEFKDAAIVHFNGHGKPNSNSCTLQYKEEFHSYLNEVTNFNCE